MIEFVIYIPFPVSCPVTGAEFLNTEYIRIFILDKRENLFPGGGIFPTLVIIKSVHVERYQFQLLICGSLLPDHVYKMAFFHKPERAQAEVICQCAPTQENGQQWNQEFFSFEDYPAQQEKYIDEQYIRIGKANKSGEPDLFRTDVGWQKGKDKENSNHHIGIQYELSDNPLQDGKFSSGPAKLGFICNRDEKFLRTPVLIGPMDYFLLWRNRISFSWLDKLL